MNTRTWPYGTRYTVQVMEVVPGEDNFTPLLVVAACSDELFFMRGVRHDAIPIRGDFVPIEFMKGGPLGGYWKIVDRTMHKLVLRTKSLCTCGYKLISDDIPIGTEYEADFSDVVGGGFVCGGCKLKWDANLIWVHRGEGDVGYLPSALFFKEHCRCNCGYRCGGPGVCKTEDCLSRDDGNHFVRDCDHRFEGPLVMVGHGVKSQICLVCGLTAATHDDQVGP